MRFLKLIISIHALRVEGDVASGSAGRSYVSNFYPRPPGGGRPPSFVVICNLGKLFLSTPSGWRATGIRGLCYAAVQISIHALRVEGDRHFEVALVSVVYFYPRPPGGGRPTPLDLSIATLYISIHALRVEGDGRV